MGGKIGRVALLLVLLSAGSHFFPLPAFAQDPGADAMFNELLSQLSSVVAQGNSTVRPFALYLFGLLAVLELSLVGFGGLFSESTAHEMLGGVFRRLITFSVLLITIYNYNMWFPPLIDLFTDLGVSASGTNGPAGTSTILDRGNSLMDNAFAAAESYADRYDYPYLGNLLGKISAPYITMVLSGIVLNIAFFLIALQLFYVKIEAVVAAASGMVVLGFSAFRGTASMAEKYIGYVLQVGLKIFFIYLILGVLFRVTATWPDYIAGTGPYSGLGGDSWSEVSQRMVVIITGSLLLAAIAIGLPTLLSRKVTENFDIGLTKLLSR